MDEICLETESLLKLHAELRMDVTAKSGEQEAVEAVTVEAEGIATEAAVEVVTAPFGWTSMGHLPVPITELLWKISPAELAGRI